MDLEASLVWSTLWDFIAEFDRSLVWCVQIGELLQRRWAVLALRPREVKVRKLLGRAGELVPVWSPGHDRVYRRPALLALHDAVDAHESPDDHEGDEASDGDADDDSNSGGDDDESDHSDEGDSGGGADDRRDEDEE